MLKLSVEIDTSLSERSVHLSMTLLIFAKHKIKYLGPFLIFLLFYFLLFFMDTDS